MNVRIKILAGLLTIAIFPTVAATGAMAQEGEDEPERIDVQTINDRYLDAFYNRSGTFFENRVPQRSITWFLGPFPENDIWRDGQSVHRVYRDTLFQQTQSDPYIRTADLVNPYDSSLLLSTPYEPVPILEAPPRFSPIFPGDDRRPTQTPPRPVPGLY